MKCGVQRNTGCGNDFYFLYCAPAIQVNTGVKRSEKIVCSDHI